MIALGGASASERILRLTLEIIYLLTGEVYVSEAKSTGSIRPISHVCVCKEPRKKQGSIIEDPPPILTPERNNIRKILNVIQKITELLTGEVPIRCQDVTVYFSMEEWEYVEGHKDLYKDVMMENRLPLASQDGSRSRNPPKRCLHPLYWDSTQEHQDIPHKHHEIPPAHPLYSWESTQEHHEISQVCPSQDFTQEHHEIPQEAHETPQVYHLYPQDSTKEHYEISQKHHEIHQVPPLTSLDSAKEHHKIPQNFKVKEEHKNEFIEMEDLNIVVVDHLEYPEDLYMKIKEEEVPLDISTGCRTCDEISIGGTTTNTQHVNTSVSVCDKATSQPKKPNPLLAGQEITRRRTKQSEEVPFICAYCGKHFNFKSVFTNHQRIHTGEKPYQCAECGNCFSQKGSLVEHQKIHKGEKPFVCPDCGKSFIQRANLYHHQKNHLNEKPYPCSECGKRFINSSRLAAHQKIHSGYKPFSCPDCGKGFLKNANLIIHQRVHTGEKPFMCSECGKCFIKNSNLVTHMRVHTGEKPFQCLKCGRCFSQSSILVRHQKTHRDSDEVLKVKV